MDEKGSVHCIDCKKEERDKKEKQDEEREREKCEAYLGQAFRWMRKDEENPFLAEAGLVKCLLSCHRQ